MKLVRMILSVAMLGIFASAASADDCGCESACGNGKICKLQRTTKKIKVTCWGSETVDKCIPCPSTKQCSHCESVCKPKCGSCCKDRQFCKFSWTDWCPGSAKKITVKKLVKYVVVKEVPSYKWVVVDSSESGDDSAVLTKPAPPTARVGDRYTLTQAELDQIPAMMARLPKIRNVTPVSTVSPVSKVSPVPKVSNVTPKAQRLASSQYPWSLFAK